MFTYRQTNLRSFDSQLIVDAGFGCLNVFDVECADRRPILTNFGYTWNVMIKRMKQRDLWYPDKRSTMVISLDWH